MLKKLLKLINYLVNLLGFEIRNTQKLSKSDDPFFVVSKILLKEDVNLIIDAGASIGNTSKYLSSLFPKAVIHAIEPQPTFYDKLVLLNNDLNQIIPHNIALSNDNGYAKFQINNSEGTSSLHKSITNSYEAFNNLLKTKKEIEVKTEKLDTFLTKNNIKYVDILKLDLQGHELFALKGCQKTLLEGKVGVILCELLFTNLYEEQASPFELLKYLIDAHSFHLFNFYQNHYNYGQIIQADVVLIHSSKMKDVTSRNNTIFHNFSNVLKF